MTDRTKYQKITTYYQAFEVVLGMKIDSKLYEFLKKLEAEGHTEKSISYAIWRTQDKLIQYKYDTRFFSILRNEILKYSWAKGDPRWDTYWNKRKEEEKAKGLSYELKVRQIEENLAKKDNNTKAIYKNKYSGYVYFIQGESGGAIKIGYTKNPESRLKTLQTSYPDILKILCLIPGSEKTEKEYHNMFQNIKLNGEWFKPDECLFEEIEKLNTKYNQKEIFTDENSIVRVVKIKVGD